MKKQLIYIFLLHNRIVATIKGDSKAKKYFLTHHTDRLQCVEGTEIISECASDVYFNKPVSAKFCADFSPTTFE